MLRLTTYVTVSPTTSARIRSASPATAARPSPVAVASARYCSSVRPAGSASAARSAATTSASARSGTSAAAPNSAARARMTSQLPKASPMSDRVSVLRPSESIAVCRSVRPLESQSSSGSCHGRPCGRYTSSSSPTAANPLDGSASARTCPDTRGSIHASPAPT